MNPAVVSYFSWAAENYPSSLKFWLRYFAIDVTQTTLLFHTNRLRRNGMLVSTKLIQITVWRWTTTKLGTLPGTPPFPSPSGLTRPWKFTHQLFLRRDNGWGQNLLTAAQNFSPRVLAAFRRAPVREYRTEVGKMRPWDGGGAGGGGWMGWRAYVSSKIFSPRGVLSAKVN